MIVSLVFSNTDHILQLPTVLGSPCPHQLTSTNGDNLIEVAGRICYDSIGDVKTRNSNEYHKHIIDVNHSSTQEHLNITLQVDVSKTGISNWLIPLVNRPGTFVSELDRSLIITANVRAIREWDKFGRHDGYSNYLRDAFVHRAKQICPLAVSDLEIPAHPIYPSISVPVDLLPDDHIWCGFYIGGVSRGLTHELVRHKWQTAISQRSTRYVDESESEWVWHPLINTWAGVINSFLDRRSNDDSWFDTSLWEIQKRGQEYYRNVYSILVRCLVASGLDKFTARKQARGAARGILGNALSTELIFSASLTQWKRIILMRASEHADAEIRLMANQVFEELRSKFPTRFDGWTIAPCKDEIGYACSEATI